MNEQKPITVFMGTGEYALTDRAIPKLLTAIEKYNSEAEWKWCLQDYLGVKADGTFTKRFTDIQTTLKDNPDENVQLLLLAMSTIVPQKEVKRITRVSSAERDAKRKVVEDDLISRGVDPEMAKKLAKAV